MCPRLSLVSRAIDPVAHELRELRCLLRGDEARVQHDASELVNSKSIVLVPTTSDCNLRSDVPVAKESLGRVSNH